MVVMVVVSALHLVPVDTAAVLAEPPQSCSTRDSCTVYGCHVLLLQDDQRAFLFQNNYFMQKMNKSNVFFFTFPLVCLPTGRSVSPPHWLVAGRDSLELENFPRRLWSLNMK